MCSSTDLVFCHDSQRFGDSGTNKAFFLVIPSEMLSHGTILKWGGGWLSQPTDQMA